MLPTHSVIAAVGSDSNGLYVEVSARWDLPSATYVDNRANPVVSCAKFDAHTHCHCQVIRAPCIRGGY